MEAKQPESGAPGSSADDLIKGGPSANGGEPAKTLEGYVTKEMYDQLEQKLGEQGNELGKVRSKNQEYNDWFVRSKPLLDKLEKSPEIVDAILEEKINSDLAKAILEGKVKLGDATVVAKAHEEVKEGLGKKEYEKISASDLEKLVKEKAEEIVSEKIKGLATKTEVSDSDEKREFENGIKEFVANTPDFQKYAGDINTWLEEHPDQYDIQIAYDAVKGKLLSGEAAKAEQVRQAEEAKKLAANAGGGYSKGASVRADNPLIDDLIARRSNPNTL